METITLNFKASGQNLIADAHPQRYASNTVNYIQAVFDLDDNWKSFDSVRAVWHNDFACISTVLDSDGACAVPHEVLTNLDEVIVNLVGSDVDGEELVDRMTTYPLRVAIIDAYARICGTETAEVTPSQFEQYVAIVSDLVHSVKDIDRIELNEDYTLTVYYSGGTSYTTESIRGEAGPEGPEGPAGPQGEPGEVTLAQLESVLPTDTASGAIASFPDGSDLFDYLSCVVSINPIQDLHGYDKPWVGGSGVNRIPNTFSATNVGITYTPLENGKVHASGTVTAGNAWLNSSITLTLSELGLNVGDTVTLSSGIRAIVQFRDSDNTILVSCDTSGYKTKTIPQGATQATIILYSKVELGVLGESINEDLWIQLETGSTPTSWTPYSNICPITGWTGCNVVVSPTQDAQDGTTYPVSWQTEAGTVYGGTVDLVTGVLTVDYVLWTQNTADMNNSEAYPGWKNFGVSDVVGSGINSPFPNITTNVGKGVGINTASSNDIIFLPMQYYGLTQSEWIALAQNVQILLSLATPTTYQLTPTQIHALLGQNNVWADCGNVEVQYKADVQRWVEKMLNA